MAISKTNKILNASLLGIALATSSLGMIAPATAAPMPTAVKTQKVVNPLTPESYRYSSEYGARCIPVIWGSTNHLGQDMAASDGNTIRAIADGTVVYVKNPAGTTSGYLAIKHVIDGETVYSGYYHMWQASKYVYLGQKVKQGQKIATVGSSGPSTAPHLHFEIWKGGFYGSGYTVNPVNYMRSKGVDLQKDAYLVYKFTKPTSCNYYATSKTTLRAQPSATSKALKTVYQNNLMVSKPGTLINGFVPVTVNGTSGWVTRAVVNPSKVKQTQPSGGIDLPSTDDTPVTNVSANIGYSATANVNMRSGANTTYNVVKVLTKGEKVITTGKKSGNWLQVKTGNTVGWVSSSYLAKTVVSAPAKPKPTPKPTPKPKPTVVKSTTYTATSNLNVREKATTNSKKVGLLQKAKTINVYSISNGWAKVSFNNKTAYISSTYLKKGKATIVSPKPVVVSKTVTYKATSNLNVREKNNASSKKVGLLKKSQNVEVSSISNGWAKITFNKKTAYVSASYLKKVSTAQAPKASSSKSKTATANVNMRSKANMSGSIVKVLPKSTKVTVAKTSGAWSQVSYSKKTGWVVSSYLK